VLVDIGYRLLRVRVACPSPKPARSRRSHVRRRVVRNDALIVVDPDTVVRWHRQWLRRQWARRSARAASKSYPVPRSATGSTGAGDLILANDTEFDVPVATRFEQDCRVCSKTLTRTGSQKPPVNPAALPRRLALFGDRPRPRPLPHRPMSHRRLSCLHPPYNSRQTRHKQRR
jgi:hypothetical protein